MMCLERRSVSHWKSLVDGQEEEPVERVTVWETQAEGLAMECVPMGTKEYVLQISFWKENEGSWF